jgi:imidazolonepropionase-like amidohydrolase
MRDFKILFLVVFVILFSIISTTYAQNTNPKKTVLTNCVVIDCTGNPPMEDMTVVITGNTIEEIRQGMFHPSPEEKNVRVFDLKGAYVLPGLWNVHTHLGDLLPDPKKIQKNEPLPPALIRAGRNCMDGIRRGFTALRNVGERDYDDVFWRDTFDAGVFVGPRIFASGYGLSKSKRYGSRPGSFHIGATDASEVEKAIHENIQNGADIIKIFADRFEQDELEMAIKTAHDNGLRITAHAAEPAANKAVAAGIDCIEHGYRLTDETINLMAEKGTYYCPTIVCNLSAGYIAERERKIAESGLPQDPVVVKGRVLVAYADERSDEMALKQREILKKAVDAGVKICNGSDSNPVGEIGLLEIEQMVFSGLTEMQALIASTRNCADLCEVLDKLGTVEEGKIADLIVISDNPLDNISNLRKLKMVFKDGKKVNLEKDEGQTSFWELYFLE